MRFIKNIFLSWAVASHARELEQFVRKLRAADADELTPIVALSAGVRNLALKEDGIDFYFPYVVVNLHPAITIHIAREIRMWQKEGLLAMAAASMVWLHTFRAAMHLELRPLAREMWRELSRAFPYVEDFAALTNSRQANREGLIDITGYQTIPDGFQPAGRDPLTPPP